MKGDLLKGNLDLLLLTVLREGPMHGYAIIEALRRRSEGAFQLPEGTIYPALHRLEEAGFLASRWSEVSGRRRREYELSGAGREAMKARQQEWQAFTGAVNLVLGAV